MNDTFSSSLDCQLKFSQCDIFEIFYNGFLIDGRSGGLVIGRSHHEGNIYLIQEVKHGSYHVTCCVENGEYIISHNAYIGHKERVEEINSYNSAGYHLGKILITKKTRIINTCFSPVDKFLLSDRRGQFVINKHATAKYFSEIEEINYNSGDFCTIKFELSKQK